ncbi:hypothetical protein ACWDBO_17850 [Streptomyces mirabilis]|uniref:hypothetical protein n=1 Tax=Streptomyces mirabilis TaxID=68239 RepID=UPI0033319760
MSQCAGQVDRVGRRPESGVVDVQVVAGVEGRPDPSGNVAVIDGGVEVRHRVEDAAVAGRVVDGLLYGLAGAAVQPPLPPYGVIVTPMTPMTRAWARVTISRNTAAKAAGSVWWGLPLTAVAVRRSAPPRQVGRQSAASR